MPLVSTTLCQPMRWLVSLSKLKPFAIECEGWRRHSSLIFLILLFTKPNIEVSGWLYQTKTHFTHIVYQPFSRMSPQSFTLYDSNPQIGSSVIGSYLFCCLSNCLVSIDIYITNHAFIVVTSICHCFTQATLPYTDV